jgi:threonine dehydrogenase-like Zn-dependent dehydrogenase
MAPSQYRLTSEKFEGMRKHDICGFFVPTKGGEGCRQEVGSRVVVNDKGVCRQANRSKAGHYEVNRYSTTGLGSKVKGD